MLIPYCKYITLTLLLMLLCSCSSDNAQIKAFKADGSLQCGSSGIELDVMALDLINAGIDVICSQKGHDGSPHLTVCGEVTGRINIYTIYTANLADAETYGFQSVHSLSGYQDKVCTN